MKCILIQMIYRKSEKGRGEIERETRRLTKCRKKVKREAERERQTDEEYKKHFEARCELYKTNAPRGGGPRPDVATNCNFPKKNQHAFSSP